MVNGDAAAVLRCEALRFPLPCFYFIFSSFQTAHRSKNKSRVNVSKYQNSRSRRQVIDFVIFCLDKAYGKLFSKNTLKGSAALYFFQNRGTFEIRNFASRPRSHPPFSD